MVHTEVVLKGDGCKCLCCSLNLYILLCLDRLVKTITPTTSLHDTSCLLINDLDLAVLDDVIDLTIKHCVCLKELSDCVYTLRLECKVCIDLILLNLLFLCRESTILLNLSNSCTYVRKDEEIRILKVTCDKVATLVCHIHRVLLLVDHEVKLVCDERHLTLIVLDVVVLHLLEELLHARLTEKLDERLILRISLVRSEEKDSTFLFVTSCNLLLCLSQEIGNQCLLSIIKTLYERLELNELLILSSWDWS